MNHCMDNKRKRIGIMGGTFDPIHNDHLSLAEQAYRQFSLDAFWMLPNGNPPHKSEIRQEDVRHRIRMIQLAIEDTPYLKFCNLETSRKEYHYTFETLQHLKSAYPNMLFYFIMGADSLFEFDAWREPELISRDCVILAAVRDHRHRAQMKEKVEELENRYGADIRLLDTPNMDIASSEIRRRIACGEDISGMVPLKVADYIKKNGLYTGGRGRMRRSDALSIRDLKKELEKEMDESRFEHTTGVMYMCAALAMRYGCDLEKAMLAGLMHDCAKCMPNAKKLKTAEKNHLEITDLERRNPFMLHAKLGAFLARKKYDIEDQEVLDAIRWHTTGRPGMTLLEKIVYIADYIEPKRDKAPNLPQIRQLAFEDLNMALLRILEDTVEYLDQGDDETDDITRQTYEYYKNHI